MCHFWQININIIMPKVASPLNNKINIYDSITLSAFVLSQPASKSLNGFNLI